MSFIEKPVSYFIKSTINYIPVKLFHMVLAYLLFTTSCSTEEPEQDSIIPDTPLEFGGDFSIMKKMEDSGGLYKIDGVVKEGMEIFKQNGYSWARLRIFHTPNMVGPVCNDLQYTIQSAQNAKKYGLKVLLNFHYSDSWADPGHQKAPVAWADDLPISAVQDSIYNYTRATIEAMGASGVLPDMIQIGNEINNGMIWPHGILWQGSGVENWEVLSALIKSGIMGVKESVGGSDIPILIHAANGGDSNLTYKFYKNIIENGVEFDVIGLSYYPWWHGTFKDLESTLLLLTSKFEHEISIVETAYYSNNWYPKPDPGNEDVQPHPPTENGQYLFLLEMAQIAKRHPQIKSIFYWKPDGLEIPKTKVNYLGRSLFSPDGEALKGITAWKDINPK